MKAIVQAGYGPPEEVLRLKDVDEPEIGDDEVLVRVHAASVHPDVWHVVTGIPYVLRLMSAGLRGPKQPVPRTDLAGRVESVGKNVTRFRPGDAVFGESHPGFQWRNGGAFAEYAAAPESALAIMPQAVTFEQAAGIPTSGIIALLNLGAGGTIEPGQRVLINGAGGGVGTLAIQLAKLEGAHVTGVDSAVKLEAMRAAGADRVLDYAATDFAATGERYDRIVDVVADRPVTRFAGALEPGGRLAVVGGSPGTLLKVFVLGPLLGLVGRKALRVVIHKPQVRELERLGALCAAGQLRAVIDSSFPLERIQEAFARYAAGGATGKIVITVDPELA